MGRHFALSDIHGNLELLREIQNELDEDDCVIFLGDAADRGVDGWNCLKEIYNDDRFIYLRGNHEEMLRKAIEENYCSCDNRLSEYHLLRQNGGSSTFESWLDENRLFDWGYKLDKLRYTHTYYSTNGNIILLSHAGYTPTNNLHMYPSNEQLLWSRSHFEDSWKAGEKVYVVHGHTWTKRLASTIDKENYTDGALFYCGGHKIDIDARTYQTNKAILFDLDTFTSYIYTLKEDGLISLEIKEKENC